MKDLTVPHKIDSKWPSVRTALARNKREQRVLKDVCSTLDKEKAREEYELQLIRDKIQSLERDVILKEERDDFLPNKFNDVIRKRNTIYTWSKQGDSTWNVITQLPPSACRGNRNSIGDTKPIDEQDSADDMIKTKFWKKSSRCPPLPPLPQSSLVALGLTPLGHSKGAKNVQTSSRSWNELRKCRYLRLTKRQSTSTDESEL